MYIISIWQGVPLGRWCAWEHVPLLLCSPLPVHTLGWQSTGHGQSSMTILVITGTTSSMPSESDQDHLDASVTTVAQHCHGVMLCNKLLEICNAISHYLLKLKVANIESLSDIYNNLDSKHNNDVSASAEMYILLAKRCTVSKLLYMRKCSKY